MTNSCLTCACGSELRIEDCCQLKYPSIRIKPELDLRTSSTYEVWGTVRLALWMAICKQLKGFNRFENTNIIIFGAGECEDLPIDFICDRFSDIVLVDKDNEALKKSVRLIPENLRHKVTHVIWDVTGLLKKYIPDIIHGRYGKYKDAVKFLNQLGKKLPEVEIPHEVKDRMPFAFTISDLILTQLSRNFVIGLNILTKGKSSLTLTNDLEPFFNRLSIQHLQLLHRVTQKEGKILVLADTFTYGEEIDNTRPKFNEAFNTYGESMFYSGLITDKMISEWWFKYPANGGSKVLYYLKKYNFKKLQCDTQYHWWWPFSDKKWYFVLCYVLTPYDYEIPILNPKKFGTIPNKF